MLRMVDGRRSSHTKIRIRISLSDCFGCASVHQKLLDQNCVAKVKMLIATTRVAQLFESCTFTAVPCRYQPKTQRNSSIRYTLLFKYYLPRDIKQCLLILRRDSELSLWRRLRGSQEMNMAQWKSPLSPVLGPGITTVNWVTNWRDPTWWNTSRIAHLRVHDFL